MNENDGANQVYAVDQSEGALGLVGGDHVFHHLDLAAVVGELAGGWHPRQNLPDQAEI